MKKYLLIGLYQQKKDEEQPRGNFIDFLYFNNDTEARKQLKDVVWDKYRVELEKFNNLYLLDEQPKIIYRASSFTDIHFLEYELEDNENLSEYHPVYTT